VIAERRESINLSIATIISSEGCGAVVEICNRRALQCIAVLCKTTSSDRPVKSMDENKKVAVTVKDTSPATRAVLLSKALKPVIKRIRIRARNGTTTENATNNAPHILYKELGLKQWKTVLKE
jgi:hypothetical protein